MPPPYKNPRGGTISHSNGTTPYIGHSGAWGESRQNDFSFVDCHGAITTDWVWVPDKILGTQIDDPLDEPPAEIIVHEQCEASYSGWFFLGGLADGDCDNGLGFVPEEHFDPWYMPSEEGDVLIGYTFSGLAKGTRYKKQAGSGEFSVTCSPLAWTAIQLGMCSGKVNYGIQIINPKVNLLGVEDALFVSPRAIKFITGQNVGATISLVRSQGNQLYEQQPLGIAGGYQWTIPSWDPFKNYIYGSIGDRIELADSDKQQSTLAFYSNLEGSGKVTCAFNVTQPTAARMEGGLPGVTTESKVVESVRPAFDHWEVRDGEVALETASNRFIFRANTTATSGQQWLDARFSLPAPFQQVGQGCFCQLITADRTLTRSITPQGIANGAPTDFSNVFQGQQAVDTGYPYQFGTTWSLPSNGSGLDNPFQPLTLPRNYTESWLTSFANDTFETWAMYRPPSKDGRDTTWIPMAQYSWKWGGTATWNNGQWSFVQSASGFNGQPLGNTDHPEWTAVSPGAISFLP